MRPSSAPSIVVTSETMNVAGASRSYVLAVPSTYHEASSYPLVLALHPDLTDAWGMRASLGLDSVSGQAAIVAYPNGSAGGWNLYDPPDRNADFAFLTALVDRLRGRFTIDPRRVFAIGMSSGAFMINQLACRRPSLFRAIVSSSGGAPSEPKDPAASHWDNGYVRCAGQTLGSGPAVMVLHGTADPVVAYESGEFTAQYWAYVNGCAPARGAAAPPPCLRHERCPADKPVVFCPIPDLKHVFWSNTAKASWAFFGDM